MKPRSSRTLRKSDFGALIASLVGAGLNTDTRVYQLRQVFSPKNPHGRPVSLQAALIAACALVHLSGEGRGGTAENETSTDTVSVHGFGSGFPTPGGPTPEASGTSQGERPAHSRPMNVRGLPDPGSDPLRGL